MHVIPEASILSESKKKLLFTVLPVSLFYTYRDFSLLDFSSCSWVDSVF